MAATAAHLSQCPTSRRFEAAHLYLLHVSGSNTRTVSLNAILYKHMFASALQVLRFMAWMDANNDNFLPWDERTRLDQASQAHGKGGKCF